jgi:hypothetical protein
MRLLHEFRFSLIFQLAGNLKCLSESLYQALFKPFAEQLLLDFRTEDDGVRRVKLLREHRNCDGVFFQASIRVARETDLDPHLL